MPDWRQNTGVDSLNSAAVVPPQRLIAHLDMDAFYASVALLRYPELRGTPMVIGGGSRHQPTESTDVATGAVTRKFSTLRDYVGRGVVMTATYEARALGLHSALGLMKAAAIAPDVVLLPTDFDAYRSYSRLFKAAVRTLAPQVEDRGIDEIYIDLTGVEVPFPRPCRARALRGPMAARTRSRACDQGRGARRHRLVLLHWRGPQQAARKDFIGPGQAGWIDVAAARRYAGPHLAACRRAR